MSYTKLFQSIVTSSIWTQDDQTRIVWITMLALANQHGEVAASIPGLARVSGVSIQATEKAIECFTSPDPYSRTKEDDGRRIEAIDGGWAILNHAKYRSMATDDDRKEKDAARKQRQRDRQSANVTPRHAPSRSVTPCHDIVLPMSRQIPQAEADEEAKADTKRINDDSSLYRSSPVRSQEKDLMERLARLLGEDEMERVGGHWRANWVRKRPDLLERGLNELESVLASGTPPDNRAAWLVDLLKRWK